MDKNQYFDECHFFIEDEKYILREQHSEDKNDYYNLYVETSLLAKRMSQTAYREFFEKQWEQRSEEDAIYISVILKATKQYVGNIVLRELESTTPEVGIDIVEKYQRQGIAYDTLQLFLRRIKNISRIEYFLVRIYSDNEPSRKLFQKLGAVKIGNEPSEYQVFLDQMKERMTEEEYEEIKRENPDMERIAVQRWIEQYKIELM